MHSFEYQGRYVAGECMYNIPNPITAELYIHKSTIDRKIVPFGGGGGGGGGGGCGLNAQAYTDH